jgi:hypothetical protein
MKPKRVASGVGWFMTRQPNDPVSPKGKQWDKVHDKSSGQNFTWDEYLRWIKRK